MLFNKKKTYEQHDNEKTSYYRHSVKPYISKDVLDDYSEFDICIIGGGLTGISSALNLADKGYSVAICESRLIGWGASGRNGGQLGNGMRKDQFFLEEKFGFDTAKEFWNLGLEAVKYSLELINKYKIDCNLQNGIISAGCFNNDLRYFEHEKNHLERYYQNTNLKTLNKFQIKEEINSNLYESGLINYGGYHINPLKFLLGLAKQINLKNVKVYENTPITNILDKGDYIYSYSNKKKIKSKKVVVGCNGYLDRLLSKIRSRFMPINNYVIATEPLGEKKARDLIRNNHAVCDTRFIIDYYRFSEDWRLIFGGGETFSAMFMKNSKNFVKKRMDQVFPTLKSCNIDFSWGGTLAITVNRLPHFGSLMNNKLIYAHGYSGHGLALSTLAGKLITEKIEGEEDRFNLLSDIKHLIIPGGDLLRRPIYSSAIFYYKFRDFLKYKF